jgi:hypothetical protein
MWAEVVGGVIEKDEEGKVIIVSKVESMRER